MIKPHQHVIAALLSTRQPKKKPSLQFEDSEFGTVICRRTNLGRYVRISLKPNGQLTATLPRGGTLRHVQQLIDTSRTELRQLLETQTTRNPQYENGQQIGQSHTLEIVTQPTASEPGHKLVQQRIVVTLPTGYSQSQTTIQTAVKAALRREAKAYLPRRLAYLSEKYGTRYERVRFANQSGRWGSCSSSGTISLNIALMNLPMELIDYVLTHELCHTVHLHHQASFWNLVAAHLPNYKQLRTELKSHNPHI